MKYHTLSTSSLAAEGKKSTLTIYTGPDFVRDKMDCTEAAIVRCELEMAQRALKLQTRRCRQLVSEYTRKLQAKELEIISERRLRDEQLTKVLRSLLVFEARLKQEQTFIRHQLEEKDDIIQRQKRELRGLRSAVQYCKTCTQLYSPSTIDSCDSSSDYCLGNQENWESGSEFYCYSVSEFYQHENSSGEETQKKNSVQGKAIYEKNKYNKSKDTNYKRCKKVSSQRRMTGTYFEVLKSRESTAESSVEDISSDINDSQKTKVKIEKVSGRIEELFDKNQVNNTFSNKMNSLHGIKNNLTEEQKISDVSYQTDNNLESETEEINQDTTNSINDNLTNEGKELLHTDTTSCKSNLISETITVFDAGDNELNENWYASASDPEDDEQRDIYRNNPVLECMNQILLQNINDPINSPPKSPELDRNLKNKTQKRVKFSDENKDASIENFTSPAKIDDFVENNKEIIETSVLGDYYETPIQGGANFYEVPQSIYSNDYEQILSKCGDSVHDWPNNNKITSPTSKIENLQENKINRMSTQKLTLAKCNNLNELDSKSHYYIDMEISSVSTPIRKHEMAKKNKVIRTPPALPPKPANLVSKFKIQNALLNKSCENLNISTNDLEPDYCSISELNLPTEKIILSKALSKTQTPESNISINNISLYDPISLDGTIPSLVAQNVEKNSIQVPKQLQIKNERIIANIASIAQINMLKSRNEPEIPKLPQVSEIIIPDESEEKKKIEHIAQDNYIKNNSQLLKLKAVHTADKVRNRIMIGTSVSNLVSNFNNQQMSQFGKKTVANERFKINNRLFSNFEYMQDYEKQSNVVGNLKNEHPSFEQFDLSQNFEEFNLDDCEIGEEYQSEPSNSLNYNVNVDENITQSDLKKNEINDNIEEIDNLKLPEAKLNTSVEIVRATKDICPQSLQSLQQLQKSLSSQRNNNSVHENDYSSKPPISRNPEPSYEHFLECTGLSSKSILTPSRMLSNHKSMLKPKDIKLRSRVKSTAVLENHSETVKYWSEPFL